MREGWNEQKQPLTVKSAIFWNWILERYDPYLFAKCGVCQAGFANQWTLPASWVSSNLCTVCLAKCRDVCVCCPRAAVGLCCPHPSPSRPTSSLLLKTTAGSRTKHSVDVERDITGSNSPTPTTKVTLRLMSVAMWSGEMLGHLELEPLDARSLQGIQGGFLKSFWMVFSPSCVYKTPLVVVYLWTLLKKPLCIHLIYIKHESLCFALRHYYF